jgi:CheY-like chemotaxis protein
VANEPVGAVPVKLPRLEGRVLLVDDDALGRKATARLLKRSGAEVVEASSGQEALAVLARDAGFVAMLTDLAMPEMDGEALAARVRDAWPQLAVVVFTGEVRDVRLQRLLGLGVKRVVSKPHTVVELVDALLSASASTSMAREALTQPR